MTWQRGFFELDKLRFLLEVSSVKDDLAHSVEAADWRQADVGGSHVGNDHVAIATVVVTLHQQQRIVLIQRQLVVVNLVGQSITVCVAGFVVSYKHVDMILMGTGSGSCSLTVHEYWHRGLSDADQLVEQLFMLLVQLQVSFVDCDTAG